MRGPLTASSPMRVSIVAARSGERSCRALRRMNASRTATEWIGYGNDVDGLIANL